MRTAQADVKTNFDDHAKKEGETVIVLTDVVS